MLYSHLQITRCRLSCENALSSITSSGLVAKDRLYQPVQRCLGRIMCIRLKLFMAWLVLMRRVNTKCLSMDSPLIKGYLDAQTSQFGSTTPSSSVKEQVVESGNASENNFQDISSQFRDALRLDSSAIYQKPEEVNGQVSPGEPNGVGSVARETLVSSGKSEMNMESALLDERSLLACIVRTIPSGGRIRISSTLPNRLGKMLAPLHWHDYRKKYGKLEDFVANHLELFVIEDDYIQVREGAQKMVAASASAAASKVAISSSSPSSMYVAMTPMAQSQGLKKNVQRGRQSSDYMAPQQRKL